MVIWDSSKVERKGEGRKKQVVVKEEDRDTEESGGRKRKSVVVREEARHQ